MDLTRRIIVMSQDMLEKQVKPKSEWRLKELKADPSSNGIPGLWGRRGRVMNYENVSTPLTFAYPNISDDSLKNDIVVGRGILEVERGMIEHYAFHEADAFVFGYVGYVDSGFNFNGVGDPFRFYEKLNIFSFQYIHLEEDSQED